MFPRPLRRRTHLSLDILPALQGGGSHSRGRGGHRTRQNGAWVRPVRGGCLHRHLPPSPGLPTGGR
jgi:hypothetical protein